MAEKEMGKPANELVFEIRYRPNSKVLDYRGSWAERISEHMSLPEWRILENRIDIFDKEGKHHCFVGFRNSGFVTRDSQTANYFPDQTAKFLRLILSFEGFDKPLLVERIGVRSKFITPYENSFDDLLKRYTQRYLRLTEQAEKAVDAKLLDIGGNLNFADKHGNFNTVSGPMIEDQMRQFFDWKDELPEVGFYYDIDYWLKPKKEQSESEILRTIGSFCKEGWERHNRLKHLIMGE